MRSPSIPDPSDVPATPVRASLSPDPNVRNGVQGAAEITVQGKWALDIVVTGSAGRGEASVPLTATAPPAIPTWLGWAHWRYPALWTAWSSCYCNEVAKQDRNRQRQPGDSTPSQFPKQDASSTTGGIPNAGVSCSCLAMAYLNDCGKHSVTWLIPLFHGRIKLKVQTWCDTLIIWPQTQKMTVYNTQSSFCNIV